METVLEELRQVHKQLASLKLSEELNDFKHDAYDQQRQKAQQLLSKWQLVAKETQAQYKQFQERHATIIDEEKKRRQDIISNFETHLQQIKQSMKEDNEKLDANNAIKQETETLKT